MPYEPADGALRQSPDSRQLQVHQSPSNVSLCHPQLDSPLLESFGELLEVPWIRMVIMAPLEVVHVVVVVVEDLRGRIHGLRVEVAPAWGGFLGR